MSNSSEIVFNHNFVKYDFWYNFIFLKKYKVSFISTFSKKSFILFALKNTLSDES